MKMTLKQQLMEVLAEAIEQEAKYIFMEFQIGDYPSTELIVNPIDNVELKAQYIDMAYDDNLVNTKATHISITGFGYCDDLGELEYVRSIE